MHINTNTCPQTLVIPSATKGRKSEQDRRTSYLLGIKNACVTVTQLNLQPSRFTRNHREDYPNGYVLTYIPEHLFEPRMDGQNRKPRGQEATPSFKLEGQPSPGSGWALHTT